MLCVAIKSIMPNIIMLNVIMLSAVLAKSDSDSSCNFPVLSLSPWAPIETALYNVAVAAACVFDDNAASVNVA